MGVAVLLVGIGIILQLAWIGRDMKKIAAALEKIAETKEGGSS